MFLAGACVEWLIRFDASWVSLWCLLALVNAAIAVRQWYAMRTQRVSAPPDGEAGSVETPP
jgi:hypothetical protein